MKTLHLNLKKKWFDMILSGEKIEEYRTFGDYWSNRLMTVPMEFLPEGALFKFKDFDTITFSNGYAKNRPQFEIKLNGFDVRGGRIEWGANPKTTYFVLKLGEIL